MVCPWPGAAEDYSGAGREAETTRKGQAMNAFGELMTPAEIAAYLRLSKAAVYALIRDIPHIKLGSGKRGGRILVRKADLEGWLAGQVREPLDEKEENERWHGRSGRAGGRRAGSGTRGSGTRPRGAASSDPRVAALSDWLRSGSSGSG